MRYSVLTITLLALLSGCHKNDDEYFDTKPEWVVATDVNKEFSMTYIVRVSVNNIVQPLVTSDELAAFIGTQCRGTATIVSNDSRNCFYLLVYGNQNDTEALIFRYFSSENNKIYESAPLDDYFPNQMVGSLDAPVILEF